jgi:glycosyltransferase involved in cell wall biosynthesis
MGSFSEDKMLSVIITNYNYERYVGEAIRSALEIDWPKVEIIVADDGSTDGSRQIIESFYSRGIQAIFGENHGQSRAAEEGYRVCAGDWILFLDSDDLVEPSIVREALKVMKPGWSLIQFQMRVIDGQGKDLRRIFPKYSKWVSSQAIRSWLERTDSYPTPPTSGNLLARSFVEKLFPFEEAMDYAIDSYFLPTAPFLGDVLTVAKPLVRYRIHGGNDGAQAELRVEKITRDLQRHINRSAYADRICAVHGIKLVSDRWRYGYYNMAMRLSSLRLAPSRHPISGDGIRRCMIDGATAVTRAQGMTPARHVAMAVWLTAVALAPKVIARALISWRFAPDTRPRILQRIIGAT